MQQTQEFPKTQARSARRTTPADAAARQTTYKPLALFYVAANALLLAGQLLNSEWSWQQFALLQWCGITGVFMIYRFNDIIDGSENFRCNLRRITASPIHVLCLVQFVLVTIPAIVLLLSELRVVLLFATCLLGLLYSVNLRIRSKNYRLKHLFLVKNALIGTLWAATIPIGANTLSGAPVIALFVFTAIQVMTGSIIRDLPDTEADRRDGVRTLPVVLGISRTIAAVHALNAVALVAGWLLFPDGPFVALMTVVVGWRAVTVVRLARDPQNPLYTNTLNLLTCVLICLLVLSNTLFA